MRTSPVPAERPVRVGDMPARAQVEALAGELLAGEGTRLWHVRSAGLVAARLSVLFDPEDAELLIVAAMVHDIGYSARIAHTGFHPLDGAAFLRAQGYPERLARLVAHHSLAIMTAPDGQLIHPERRLADIARRHPGREHADRACQLRAAIARVETALLAGAATESRHVDTKPGDGQRPWVESHQQRWHERRQHEGYRRA